MSKSRAWLALVGSTSIVALAAASARAQTAPEATAAPRDSADVVVTAPREELRARAAQYNAPNIVNVQSAETIAKYPDFNAAEALGRIPGVSLSSDTGEGRFVNIRGLDANLNGATYGGVVLLNTNPGGTAAGGGGRAVEFDTIPLGAIDGIVVTKTLSPDHEAEGLGGTVELTPRQASRITKPFLDATLGWGYEPLHDHTGPFDGEVAVGARFGLGDGGLQVEGVGEPQAPRAGWISNPAPFSFVLNYSRRDDRRGVDDLEQGYIDDGLAPSHASSGFDLRRYDYHRRRFGYGGEFDFTPNDDHRFYVRADVAGYTEAVHKNFLLFRNVDAAEDGDTGAIPAAPGDPKGFLTTTQPQITLTDEQETHRNQVYVAGGEDRFGRTLLDYHVAYSRATFNVGYNIGARFAGPTVPFAYDNTTDTTYPTFGFPGGFNVDDASQYKLNRLTDNTTADRDEERTYAVNLLTPLRLFSDDDRLKVGLQARIRDKAIDQAANAFADVPKLSLADASGPANIFYDDHYSNGPYIDRYAIRALVAGGSGVQVTAPVEDPTSYVRARENVYAAYAQWDVHWGPAGLLAGVRVEHTDARYTAYEDAVPADGGDDVLSLVSRPSSYTNAFPTVQLRYEVTPKLLVRATYSTGIGRPGFTQVSAASSVDFTASPILISRGNPELKPTLGDNFDLDAEYYLPQGGILEVGLFDKEFSNYIVPRIQERVTTDPLAPGELATVTTFLNVSDAYARGIEAAYNQRFAFLPGALKGLGLEANVTYVDSEILEYAANQSATGKDEYGLLPGTSRLTWNLAGFYEAYGVQARLSAQYVGPSLFGLGGDKSLDVIQDERLTLDFTSSYQLRPGIALYFNARNLLDTPLRYYEGSSDRPIQREFYDVTYEGGLRVHF